MKSSTLYTNRYGDEYYWHPVDDNVYELRMSGSSLDYATIGFKRMEEDGIDYTDLRCFDPSGGPLQITKQQQMDVVCVILKNITALSMQK